VEVVAGMETFEFVTRAAVSAASERIRATWRSRKNIHYKGTVDLVTDTDREVEALIVGRLRHAFPDHVIIAEEASAGTTLRAPQGPGYVWYLDPLDGTTNFAHGFPQFAVSLALARGGELQLAIVCDPVRDETFVAHHGGGATLNGEPIHVSDANDLERALLATGFPYDRQVRGDFYLGFVADFMRQAQDVRRVGSAALDLCYVACGRFDGFWEFKLHPWDTAAGTLIVREAGGMVSDFRGAPFDLHSEQILASNGRLHAAMVRVLAERLDRSR
jgi:myo-inositol-1(or 4)-monophosphatase